MAENNGWQEHKQLVLYRLDEQGGKLDHIQEQLDGIKADINQFKGSARVWGAISGLVVAAALELLGKLFN